MIRIVSILMLALCFSSSSFPASASSKHSTIAPFCLYAKSSFSESFFISLLPRTLSSALRVPGLASKPAWTIALLALEVPSQTSLSLSITHILSLYFESSIAAAQPTAPAPIIITSYTRSPLWNSI